MRYLLIVIVVMLVTAFALEILSRTYRSRCKTPREVIQEVGNALCARNPTVADAQTFLEELRRKRANSETISKKEYQTAMEKLIVEVGDHRIRGLNGLACGDFGFVRDDLPRQAKSFVRRHELEHLLQASRQRGNRELAANIAAIKEYPAGALQIVLTSIDRGKSKFFKQPVCSLVTIWEGFKLYFLPF